MFLRKLEYYEGIIVLTTNLLHLMDPAFQSRVKFAIRFDKMDVTIRSAIWTNILTHSNLEHSVKKSELWATRDKYNGRHIRNVVWNARVLAHSDKERKFSEAVKEVLEDTDSFIDQIEKAKKEEDEKLLQGW